MPWLLALPGLVALIAFHFLPIVFGAFYAFTSWDGFNDATWIGLKNFREIFGDEIARGAFWHTLELAGCFALSVNVIGLTLALGLHRAVKTRNVLRTLFFAPVALSPLAIALLSIARAFGNTSAAFAWSSGAARETSSPSDR